MRVGRRQPGGLRRPASSGSTVIGQVKPKLAGKISALAECLVEDTVV